MTDEYIDGFTKTAEEYGFDATSLLKQASSEKSAGLLTWLHRLRQDQLAPMARDAYDPYKPGGGLRTPAQTNSVRNASSMSPANPLRPVAQFGNALRDYRQRQLGRVGIK